MAEQPLKKEELVRNVFENIQDRYDLLDSLISAGMDQRWRRRLIWSLNLKEGAAVLDCGAGTGKLTRMILESCPTCKVTSLDITEGMFRPSILPDCKFVVASAQDMPFENESFDAVVSAYLTRNLESVDSYFSEAMRVLKQGGMFANLDIYNPTIPGFSQFFALYFYHFVPFLGDHATDSDSYTYLAKSVKNFFHPETIAEKIISAGFRDVNMQKMMLGSIALHVGKK